METILVQIFYFSAIFAISIGAYYYTNTHKDYILGGRNLGSVVTALGAGASDMSSWLMLGLPAAVYLTGYSQFWMPIGLIAGAFLNWIFVARRLRAYTEITNDALTLPSYLAQRFDGNNLALRVFTALVILVAFTFYCAAGLVGCAKLFSLLFDISYTKALLISAPFIILYTFVGGFLAVNWVDLFQGALMLFALLLVPIVVIMQLGGWSNTVLEIQAISPDYTNIIHNTHFVTIISLLAWGLGYFGQPHILVRFMASRSITDLSTSKNICMIWMILSLAGAVLIGMVGRVYFMQHPEITLSDPELVFIELSRLLFNPWIAGILFAAVLSAIISTVAAQLMASASSLQEDFYHTYVRPQASGKELLWIGRATVVLVALMAVWLALNPESSVLELVAHAWGGLGATFGPVILFSLFWRRMNAEGALCGMIAGAAGILLFGFILELEFLQNVYEILPGFICGILGIVIGSYLFGKKPSEKVQQEFDLMLTKLK